VTRHAHLTPHLAASPSVSCVLDLLTSRLRSATWLQRCLPLAPPYRYRLVSSFNVHPKPQALGARVVESKEDEKKHKTPDSLAGAHGTLCHGLSWSVLLQCY
jgi:hypothetical protein